MGKTRLLGKSFKKYKGPVYDLTVENTHTYNIDGIAVHNSAAGSLIAYVLYITHLDPIKYGLIFERFLNPGRIGKPIIEVEELELKHFEEKVLPTLDIDLYLEYSKSYETNLQT